MSGSGRDEQTSVGRTPTSNDWTRRARAARQALVEAFPRNAGSAQLLERVRKLLSGRPALGVFAAAFVYASYSTLTAPGRPGAITPRGWYAGGDQSYYLAEVTALVHGHLPDKDHYRYGLGYPLLAAPFKALGMSYPFSIVNIILLALMVALVFLIGCELLGRRFGYACAFATVVATPIFHVFLPPWSNLVTMVAVLACTLVACRPSVPWRQYAWVVGLSVCFTFSARYADVVWPAAIAAVGAWRVKERRATALAAVGVAGVVVLAVTLLTHLVVLGHPLTTPYAFHGGSVGPSDQSLQSFKLSRVGSRFLDIFVTGHENGSRAALPSAWLDLYPFVRDFPLTLDPLLLVAPLTVLVPLGFMRMVPASRRLTEPNILVALGVSVVGTIFYLSFSGNSQIFGSARYFAVWMPLWVVAGLFPFFSDTREQRRRHHAPTRPRTLGPTHGPDRRTEPKRIGPSNGGAVRGRAGVADSN
ncbi:MAG: hypothetical protein QOJ32_1099 [Frankiaceae bacterium]|nr:hypothetical protein [Frankiaceae bacterium]